MSPRLRRADCSAPGLTRRKHGQGLHLPRRRRRAGHRARGPRADRRARHPAGLEGRLDLPGRARAPAGDRDRRRRPQAVPLPPAVAHAARLREVRRDDPLRRRAAEAARARRRAADRHRRAHPRARAGLRGAAARPRLLPRRLRAVRGRERVLRPRHDAQGARHARPRALRDGVRLRGQERQAAHPGRRSTPTRSRSSPRSSAAAAAGPELLAFKDGRSWSDVRSPDINEYLKEATGDDFSAKDFRTWAATMLAAIGLAVAGEVAATEDRPQARRRARGQGGLALPRQHARGLPRLLHRPARDRRLQRRADDRAACSRRSPTPTRSASCRSTSRWSSRRCSTCSTSARRRRLWSGSRREAARPAARSSSRRS